VPRLGSTAARLKLKGIDGGPHKRRSMWLNSTQREEPYQGLTYTGKPWRQGPPCGRCTGGAWLSSARVVRCWVKSRNERNPCLVLPATLRRLGTHGRLPGSTRRKVGTTSSHHAPYVLGCTRATMAGTMSCDTVRWSESQKAGLSSDWGLQLDPMKSESLVIADQHCCGEYVPGPCTHRPSRHESR
jgi:hypothetical protein